MLIAYLYCNNNLGKILVNGEQLSAVDMHRISCYVHQDDVFIGTLTVREQLIFSAELRMDRKVSKVERLRRVEQVLKELSLKRCETTLIGITNRLKGISCGESKRLAFACEILNDPPILFCDEPTSGLDSFMAVQVVHCLQQLAKKGKTIITTIHQPSSQVFSMFDNINLMVKHLLFKYNFRIGYSCPETYNPADHVIKTLSNLQVGRNNTTEIIKIWTKFEESPLGMALYRKSHGQESQREILGNVDLKARKMYAASFLAQFRTLLKRSFLTTIPKFFYVTAVIIGMVNFQTQITGPTIMNIEGLLYNTVRDMNFMFLFPSINLITSELPIFLREHRSSRIYSASAYYLAKSVAEIPEYVMLPIIYAVIVYFMTGLRLTLEAFSIYCFLTIVITNLAISIAYAGACIFGGDSLALTYMPCFILPNLVFGGFYISFQSIPIYYQFISYISWFRFGFEAFQVNQWLHYKHIPGINLESIQIHPNQENLNFAIFIFEIIEQKNGFYFVNFEGCDKNSTELIESAINCPAYSGEDILLRRGMGTSQAVIIIDTIILIIMMIGFRVIGLLALVLRVRFTR
ncbi:unnamed protein product [Thelazia callipaeda]|uniref:ABC transporter domain-containing protein n=1 Tax=Thelazia callipaeda TaxID=103827 RepID=A0A0N5D8Z6_THECL|nr:unnamed protein product [Thelazia callipaeda]